MAARWREGEEMFSTCTMELFSTNALSEGALTGGSVHDPSLDSRDILQSFTDCLDTSILSLFEESSVNAKHLDEDSEATLLTALTEILDNVDEDNLSPFDTLPDSEFLSGQKGRDQAPLKRLLNLSLCSSDNPKPVSSVGKVEGLGMVWEDCPWWEIQGVATQRSDGEEEGYAEASDPDPSFPGSAEWGLPLNSGQEGNYVSVNLCHLVKSMHPYCIPVCLEPAEGDSEHVLPEGGILLEVVDQGDQGEPILAVPDLNFSVVLLKEESEQRVPEEEIPKNARSEDVPRGLVLPYDSARAAQEMEEKVTERPKEETSEKRPSRRKKKRKPIEGLEPVSQKPHESGSRSSKQKKRVTVARPIPSAGPGSPAEETTEQIERPDPQEAPRQVSAAAKLPAEMTTESDSWPTPLTSTQPLQPEPDTDGVQAAVSQQVEPKPKPLSLQQYRLLRQKRRPAPQENQEDHRTKWPTLPEPPTELPPLPCLLEPSPRDPRRMPDPQLSKTAPEVTPVWRPKGSCAPPVPEALLVPLVSALVSSNKIPAPPAKPHLAQPALTASLAAAPERPTSRDDLAPGGVLRGTGSSVGQSLPTSALQHSPLATRPLQAEEASSLQRTVDSVGSQSPASQGMSTRQQDGVVSNAGLRPAPPTDVLKSQRDPLPPTTANTTEQEGQSDPTPQEAEAPKGRPLLTKPAVVALGSPPQPGLRAEDQTTKPQRLPGNNPTPVRVPGNNPTPVRVPGNNPTPVQVPGNNPTPVRVPGNNPTPVQVPVNNPTPVQVHGNNPTPVQVHGNNPTPVRVPGNNPTPVRVPGNNPTPVRVPGNNPTPVRVPGNNPTPVQVPRNSSTPVQEPPSRKTSCTRELIQAFTTEIGIEATDLTSLLEQFEETQAKEQQSVPEVCGGAAAVGSSGVEQQLDRKSVENTQVADLTGTAGLTPPATPPHQIWKPLAPVALLGNPKSCKRSPSKVVQINPRPLTLSAASRKTLPPRAPVQPAVSLDHDYCFPPKSPAPTGGLARRWNVQRQTGITIRPIERPSPQTTAAATPGKLLYRPLDHRTEAKAWALTGSVLLSPESSPRRPEVDVARPQEERPKSGSSFRCSEPRGERGRAGRVRRARSPSSRSSGSSSESPSRSPRRKRFLSRHSESSSSSCSPPRKRRYSVSCSGSCSLSRSRSRSRSHTRSRSRSRSHSRSRSPPRRRRCSLSRSGSWSLSRSRSPPGRPAQWWRNDSCRRSPSHRQGYRFGSRDDPQRSDTKSFKEKAIEERRVVYVGRIRGGMSRSELKERFSVYGEIEECTLHFRDHRDNYGFITYYDTKDAFNAIENGGKLRLPDELPFDLCFGGRRQFCGSSYADLDSNRDYDPSPAKGKFDALDFDTLLKQAQKDSRR